MKTKDLFNKLEAANFMARQMNEKEYRLKAYFANDKGFEFAILNEVTKEYHFKNMTEFAASIALDFESEVCALIGTANVCMNGEGTFAIGSDDIVKNFRIRFYLCHA